MIGYFTLRSCESSNLRPCEQELWESGWLIDCCNCDTDIFDDGLGEDGEFGTDPWRPGPFLGGFWSFLMYSSRCSGRSSHFIPLPGSSVRRGIFLKALLRDKL